MIPLCHTFGVGLGARYNSNKMKIKIRTIVKKICTIGHKEVGWYTKKIQSFHDGKIAS